MRTASISAPRSTTSRAASSSENTPAAHAAAISPTECPITTSGTTPHDPRSRTNATSNAKIPGCANRVPSIREPSTTTSETSAGKSPSTSCHADANTGNAAANPRPIPAHCEP